LLASLGIHIPAQRKAPRQAAASATVPSPAVVTVVEQQRAQEEEAVAARPAAPALEPDAISALFAPSSSQEQQQQTQTPAASLRLSYSSLFQYRACPLSYYYAHVLALPTRQAPFSPFCMHPID
jgi:hypothetical protein